MATITNRGNGSWRVTLSGGYNPEGKQIRITRTIHVNPKNTEKSQRQQVEKMAAQLQTDYDRQQITDAKKLAFKDVYNDYIADRIIRKGLAERTADSYKTLFRLELLPAFGNTAIRDITARDINKFLQKLKDKGFSGTYSKKFFQQLHEMFVYAQRTGLIVINPCDLVEPPKIDTPEAQYYDLKECLEIEKLIKNHDDPEWKAFFSLSFYCGTRPGELVGLNWGDYDGTNIFIQSGSYQGKGKKTTRTSKPKTKKSIRKIQLTPEAISALDKWKKAQEEYRLRFGRSWPEPNAVFTGDEGYRTGINYPGRKWRDFTKKHNIRHLPLYDLRHTNCSLLISSRELSIEEIAARMGHEQTSTTLNIYSHAFANSNERATQALTNVLKQAANE